MGFFFDWKHSAVPFKRVRVFTWPWRFRFVLVTAVTHYCQSKIKP
jgi:hypothetical protein